MSHAPRTHKYVLAAPLLVYEPGHRDSMNLLTAGNAAIILDVLRPSEDPDASQDAYAHYRLLSNDTTLLVEYGLGEPHMMRHDLLALFVTANSTQLLQPAARVTPLAENTPVLASLGFDHDATPRGHRDSDPPGLPSQQDLTAINKRVSQMSIRPVLLIDADYLQYEKEEYERRMHQQQHQQPADEFDFGPGPALPHSSVSTVNGVPEESPHLVALTESSPEHPLDIDRARARAPPPANRLLLHQRYEASPAALSSKLDQDLVGRTREFSLSFRAAAHPFAAALLHSESDALICLLFEKDDVCFVHVVDPSGWGEVTMVGSLRRGWVPLNYFHTLVDYDADPLTPADTATLRLPLTLLLAALAKFLADPQSVPVAGSLGHTFPTRTVNLIRDGVRALLEETDCISRSLEIVTQRPIIKKIRKVLLADWFALMKRAQRFRNTTNVAKIERLQIMTYQVLRKAIAFLDIWGIEAEMERREVLAPPTPEPNTAVPFLRAPPYAVARVTEIHQLLLSYLALIMGRLDLVSGSSAGCELLENVTHQIILLLRELLYINKSVLAVQLLAGDVDKLLDALLALVLELVAGVKKLVAGESDRGAGGTRFFANIMVLSPASRDALLPFVAARVVQMVLRAVSGLRAVFEKTGDFVMDETRQHPDFQRFRISPEQFVRKCAVDEVAERLPDLVDAARAARRLYLPPLDLTPFTADAMVFAPYTTDDPNAKLRVWATDEIMRDPQGHITGALFRGLVYTLTNENDPPEYFLVTTFLSTFRLYGTGGGLVEELALRFESTGDDVPLANIAARRRLVCRTLQLWLESFWDHTADYKMLPAVVNFVNEGVALRLLAELRRLLETAAWLVVRPPPGDPRDLISPMVFPPQLVHRPLKESKREGGVDPSFSMVDVDAAVVLADIVDTSPPATAGPGEPLMPLLEQWFRRCAESIAPSRQPSTRAALPRTALVDSVPAEALAEALTQLELALLVKIGTLELVNNNFAAHRAHLNRAPYVLRSVRFTNCLSAYVIELVLEPRLPSPARQQRMRKWTQVGAACLERNNVNSLAAIMAALQLFMITRVPLLRLAYSGPFLAAYNYLCLIVNPHKNYAVYRGKLRQVVAGGNPSRVPCVPYVSLFVQDLAVVADGNPDWRSGERLAEARMVNVVKHLTAMGVIADLQATQVAMERGVAKGVVPWVLDELVRVRRLNAGENDRAWRLSGEAQQEESQ